MPRIGRLHIPGGCYHVMGRGLERRHVFSSDPDRQDFVSRLETGLSETGIQCLAWAIMGNHYHLLVQVDNTPLSNLMRKLLSGYASSYNRRHHRVGYVFQNRYKSILCDEESYLLELVRYIHLNPLRAKTVGNLFVLDQYPWTGHSVLMGQSKRDWQQTQEVLARFGKRMDLARRKYRGFMKDGLRETADIDYGGGGLIRSYGGWQSLELACKKHERKIGDERVLGDSQFVTRALEQDRLLVETQTRLIRAGWDLEKLIRAVCARFQVDPSRITEKGRNNPLSVARSVTCYLGMKKLHLSSTDIGIRLKMGQSAVSAASKRGRTYCEKHKLDVENL